MMSSRLRSVLAAGVAIAFAGAPIAMAQTTGVLDESAPPGNNYDKAEFRFWAPKTSTPLRAIVVLVPGSNGDGRGQVEDTVWQAFATKHSFALVGVRLTDKPHDQNFIEEYIK